MSHRDGNDLRLKPGRTPVITENKPPVRLQKVQRSTAIMLLPSRLQRCLQHKSLLQVARSIHPCSWLPGSTISTQSEGRDREGHSYLRQEVLALSNLSIQHSEERRLVLRFCQYLIDLGLRELCWRVRERHRVVCRYGGAYLVLFNLREPSVSRRTSVLEPYHLQNKRPYFLDLGDSYVLADLSQAKGQVCRSELFDQSSWRTF